MKFPDPIFDLIGIPILVGLFIFLWIMESKFQLRKRVQKKSDRFLTNTGIATVSLVLLRLVFIPAMVWLAVHNNEWKFGLNYLYQWPVWTEFVIGFLFLDYTNYVWHILNHKFPLLWRFHVVHHTDLDLDLNTGIRFHFGELIGSIFFRGAMVLLTGASPVLVLVYEIIFEAATNFHHSNWKLPLRFEKVFNILFVTPRMHGIHHSIIKNETDSNFSVIFSFWDRLHKTLHLNIAQQDIIIGTPSYRDPAELTLLNLLLMPFRKLKSWQFADGTVPERSDTDKNRVHFPDDEPKQNLRKNNAGSF